MRGSYGGIVLLQILDIFIPGFPLKSDYSIVLFVAFAVAMNKHSRQKRQKPPAGFKC